MMGARELLAAQGCCLHFNFRLDRSPLLPLRCLCLFVCRGEGGWFRLIRGVDALGIEDMVSWATPKVTWPKDE